MKNRSCFLLVVLGFLLLTACAASLPSVKVLAKEDHILQTAATGEDSYVIGPGDLLSISVWKEPELSAQQVSVRLDGKVSLPLLNDVDAAGFTCADLRNRLSEKYKAYLEVPEISVILVESRSKRIYLLGEVVKPGEYPLQKNMNVIQAIALASGPTPFANTSKIRLIRKIKGVEKQFRVDYDAIVSGKDVEQNIRLKPDDTLYVP